MREPRRDPAARVRSEPLDEPALDRERDTVPDRTRDRDRTPDLDLDPVLDPALDLTRDEGCAEETWVRADKISALRSSTAASPSPTNWGSDSARRVPSCFWSSRIGWDCVNAVACWSSDREPMLVCPLARAAAERVVVDRVMVDVRLFLIREEDV